MKDVIKNSLNKMRKNFVVHDEVYLPAAHLRTGGEEFQSDKFFLLSAKNEAQRLIDHFDINLESSILDIGCGFGRLPIGLQKVLKGGVYQGVDVNPTAIDWCNKYISRPENAYTFLCLDAKNERYNPNGEKLTKEFTFPFMHNSFDVAYLYSVFSHMHQNDISIYLNEIYRLLSESGHVFFTAFIEYDVPDKVENPVGYGNVAWKNALHCVRYNYDFFLNMIEASGFVLDRFEHGVETNGQSGVYLSKRA